MNEDYFLKCNGTPQIKLSRPIMEDLNIDYIIVFYDMVSQLVFVGILICLLNLGKRICMIYNFLIFDDVLLHALSICFSIFTGPINSNLYRVPFKEKYSPPIFFFGIQPSLNWVCYCWVPTSLERGTLISLYCI